MVVSFAVTDTPERILVVVFVNEACRECVTELLGQGFLGREFLGDELSHQGNFDGIPIYPVRERLGQSLALTRCHLGNPFRHHLAITTIRDLLELIDMFP